MKFRMKLKITAVTNDELIYITVQMWKVSSIFDSSHLNAIFGIDWNINLEIDIPKLNLVDWESCDALYAIHITHTVQLFHAQIYQSAERIIFVGKKYLVYSGILQFELKLLFMVYQNWKYHCFARQISFRYDFNWISPLFSGSFEKFHYKMQHTNQVLMLAFWFACDER